MQKKIVRDITALKELRTQAKVTQAELGEKIGVIQRRISTIELSDPDSLQLSTLRSYVEGLGGSLDVIAVVKGKKHIIA